MLAVEALENLFQVVAVPLRSRDEFPPANLPYQVCLPPYVPAVEVQPVTVGVHPRHRLAVELAQQDVRQRFGYRRRCSRQDVGNAHQQAPVFQPDEAVGIREAAELDAHLRHHRARLQFAEHAGINLLRRLEKQGALESLESRPRYWFSHLPLEYRAGRLWVHRGDAETRRKQEKRISRLSPCLPRSASITRPCKAVR